MSPARADRTTSSSSSQCACDHPDRLAAIAAVAGLRAGAPVMDADGTYVPDLAACRPGRGVPVLSFSGTADPVNPYAGGGEAYWGAGLLVGWTLARRGA
ncbi:hypothetical protein [Streptomyces sp. NBC_00258]|uniref:hypothetical protein n=1 Tax=Streptomyces sp. NBC_00258 TaxID=2903642 RepID=UPI002E2BF8E7|nr:hypothetical protein [Streptomyces sp. NBC_00258]